MLQQDHLPAGGIVSADRFRHILVGRAVYRHGRFSLQHQILTLDSHRQFRIIRQNDSGIGKIRIHRVTDLRTYRQIQIIGIIEHQMNIAGIFSLNGQPLPGHFHHHPHRHICVGGAGQGNHALAVGSGFNVSALHPELRIAVFRGGLTGAKIRHIGLITGCAAPDHTALHSKGSCRTLHLNIAAKVGIAALNRTAGHGHDAAAIHIAAHGVCTGLFRPAVFDGAVGNQQFSVGRNINVTAIGGCAVGNTAAVHIKIALYIDHTAITGAVISPLVLGQRTGIKVHGAGFHHMHRAAFEGGRNAFLNTDRLQLAGLVLRQIHHIQRTGNSKGPGGLGIVFAVVGKAVQIQADTGVFFDLHLLFVIEITGQEIVTCRQHFTACDHIRA